MEKLELGKKFRKAGFLGGRAKIVRLFVRLRRKKRPASLQAFDFKWCRHQESNPGPTDYKSVALPTELYRRVRATIIAIGNVL